MSASPPRILVIRRRYLGDIVLFGSVFRNLRLHWPSAHLAALVEAPYAGVLPLNPDVDAPLVFPRHLGQWPAFVRTLRRGRYTHVIDSDNNDRTHLVTRLTGAPVRITYRREKNLVRHQRSYTGFATVTGEFYWSHHITETYLALLEPLGVPVRTRDIRLVPGAADRAFARALLGAQPPAGAPRRVLVHPGSRSPFRIWPPERFAAICDRLQADAGAQVWLAGGPAEHALVSRIRSLARRPPAVLDRPLTIGQLTAVLAGTDLFVCHDSGPMHIAAAVGTPVVALFGSQSTVMWRPLGEGHTVLQTPLPCTCLPDLPTPCAKTDAYRSYCVRKLGEEEVFGAIAAALERREVRFR